MRKNKYDLGNIKSLLRLTLSGLTCTTNKYILFSIKKGRQIPKSGEVYLLNVIKIGEQRRGAFADECQKTI